MVMTTTLFTNTGCDNSRRPTYATVHFIQIDYICCFLIVILSSHLIMSGIERFKYKAIVSLYNITQCLSVVCNPISSDEIQDLCAQRECFFMPIDNVFRFLLSTISMHAMPMVL